MIVTENMLNYLLKNFQGFFSFPKDYYYVEIYQYPVEPESIGSFGTNPFHFLPVIYILGHACWERAVEPKQFSIDLICKKAPLPEKKSFA